jgi:cytochrome c oxidase cbb3-type subunit I/II
VFDHPFQWGSRRIGPDLARVGGKYPNVWHYQHMRDPREISEGSNMPPYPRMLEDSVDFGDAARRMRAMRSVGVPYTALEVNGADIAARQQAEAIAADLLETGKIAVPADREIIAVIAYLQRLGKPPPVAPEPTPAPEVP